MDRSEGIADEAPEAMGKRGKTLDHGGLGREGSPDAGDKITLRTADYPSSMRGDFRGGGVYVSYYPT